MTEEMFAEIVDEGLALYNEYLCEGPVGDPERRLKSDQDYWIVRVAYERGFRDGGYAEALEV